MIRSEKLENYLENKFKLQDNFSVIDLKINSDSNFWKPISNNLEDRNCILSFLKDCYPQLNFPVKEGISNTTEYKNCVLKGHKFDISDYDEKDLIDSKNLSFEVYDSFSGYIPILTINNNEDFTKAIQTLIYKNNPVAISKSMGATLINGLNNWNKIELFKQVSLQKNPNKVQSDFFKELKDQPQLYKDKLIILSNKPYSNVNADVLNLDDQMWLKYSLIIRKEHECTHLYTLKKYGKATNNLHDELIADYIGIIKANGDYNKDWMLNFMGLENFPHYRKGARLENYINQTNLDEQDFKNLTLIVKLAIDSIEEFHKLAGNPTSNDDISARIDTLCENSLIAIADSKKIKNIFEEYSKKLELYNKTRLKNLLED